MDMSISNVIFNKIVLYNSHPVADVFRSEFHQVLHKFKTYYDDDDGDMFYNHWRCVREDLQYKNHHPGEFEDEDDENDDADAWD